MLDLQQFCSTDPDRPQMHAPFSSAAWTWATNGHILVRVPRRDDVPENPEAPNVKKVWDGAKWGAWRPAKRVDLPPARFNTCDECNGRGWEHDCPSCQCTCEECGGEGKIERTDPVAVGPVKIALRYARMILALDRIELADPADDDDAIAFRFAGGEGILAVLHGPCVPVAEI